MSISINTVKTITKFVVGTSTAATVTTVIKNNTNPQKLHQKVEIAVGALAIGGLVASQTEARVDAFFDAFFVTWNKTKMQDDVVVVQPAE